MSLVLLDVARQTEIVTEQELRDLCNSIVPLASTEPHQTDAIQQETLASIHAKLHASTEPHQTDAVQQRN